MTTKTRQKGNPFYCWCNACAIFVEDDRRTTHQQIKHHSRDDCVVIEKLDPPLQVKGKVWLASIMTVVPRNGVATP
jgi:hypothetical protein